MQRVKQNTHTIIHYGIVFREYEARIARLQEEFGREQADRTRLQQELDSLQLEWDSQLANAEVRQLRHTHTTL